MPTPQQQLMKQLVDLTGAVKELAGRPAPPPPVVIDVDIDVDDDGDQPPNTDSDQVQQRVAFSYRALGTLTGRVSTASGREFDVRIVRARRPRDLVEFDDLPSGANLVEFDDLPPGANLVELRSGSTIETLRIRRTDDGRPDRGVVQPRLITAAKPISSMVFLRTPDGPLIAFGPRLPAVQSTRT